MYKVFFNDRIVFITDDFKKFFPKNDGMLIKYSGKSSLKIAIEKFEKNQCIPRLIIYGNDVNEIKFIFESFFHTINAAGGVIRNEKNEILMIFRRGKWDLPKGKVEKKEEFKDAAIRECEEETGLKGISIVKTIHPTHHTYVQNGVNILKTTYWYDMAYTKGGTPVPQVEEDITEVKWVKPSLLASYFDNSFLSVVDVLKESLN